MNKTLLAILAIVVIAVIGMYAYANMGDDTATDPAMTASSSSSSVSDAMTSSAPAMTPPSSSRSSSSADAMEAAVYTEYREGVIGNGEPAVLFFHAAWCPDCREADGQLQAIYGTEAPKISVYKVDYDSSAELKQRYGVTYQHTFVVIDGEGNETETLQGATAAQLQALVQ